MHKPTGDLRIRAVRPLLPPAILAEETPVSDEAADLIRDARETVVRCLRGEDPRLVVVVGPCSLHDVRAGIEYAERLKVLADRYRESLFVVMRAYFEKPRTTVGWKGLVNDPDIDESFQINKGLRLARKFLMDLTDLGLPAGTEFLDMTVPQHLADFVSWGAIGARTSESQTHRELASGLSMPVGFKNATDGNIRTAIDAVKAAQNPHWFLGATKDGLSAILQTTGNDCCHIILRGGSRSGPNFSREHVLSAAQSLQIEGLADRVMVDFSHANSLKKHERQMDVGRDVAAQIAAGDSHIFGVMIESFLIEGRQDFVPGKPAVYGQSITDACLSWAQTEPLLELLAESVRR
ncbi:MAG TPA: 3-deoxy-7-phosphoheptulonate synthase [Fimbriimonas sp.]